MHAGIYCHSYTIITLVVVAGLQQKKAYAEAYSYFRTEVKVLSRLAGLAWRSESGSKSGGKRSRLPNSPLPSALPLFAICHLPSAVCHLPPCRRVALHCLSVASHGYSRQHEGSKVCQPSAIHRVSNHVSNHSSSKNNPGLRD